MTTASTQPPPPLRLCDPAHTKWALGILYEKGLVVEVRVLEGTERGQPRYTRNWYGYFDNGDALVRALDTLGTAKGIYFSLNPVSPKLLSRANNRLRHGEKGSATLDELITQRRWLLVDFDAARPSEISATEEEKAVAFTRAEAVRSWLATQGWPAPLLADSGNGAHLLYRVDLPNGELERTLVEQTLKALSARFSDPSDSIKRAKHGAEVLPHPVEVDTTVFNAARICKLYGTLVCKGDSTAERPHRSSRLLDAPEGMQVVARELLEQVAATAPRDAAPAAGRSAGRPGVAGGAGGYRQGSAPEFSLERWIGEHLGGMVQVAENWKGDGRRWIFDVCPFDSGHARGEAYIGQLPSGAITAGCQHQSCTWGWPELRERFDPGCYDRKGSAAFSLTTPDAADAVANFRQRIEAIPADADPLLLVAQFLPPVLDLLSQRPPFELDSYLDAIKARWPKLTRQQISDMRKAIRAKRKTTSTAMLDKLLHWRTTENGSQILIKTVHNLANIYRHHEERPGHWFNDFSYQVIRILPDGTERPIEDNDYTADREWLSRLYDLDFPMDMVARTIEAVAKESRRNPLRSYLESLVWDGAARLDTWLVQAAGVQDTPLNREIGRKFLIGAIARALDPGCKMDSTLILVTKQGAGKSTLFRILAGKKFFSDSKVDLTANLKDAYQLLADVWFVEFAELFAFKKAEAEAIKSFLTAQMDHFRPSYGRNMVTIPRHCVFCGTTNEDEFLRDPTGSRRFWCVRGADIIDVAWAEENRDQLWAEAVDAYRCPTDVDHRWWLTPEAEQQRSIASQEFEEYDPWTEAVLEYVDALAYLKLAELTDHIKKKFEAQEGWHTTNRLSAILRRLRWTSKNTKTDGKVIKRWYPPKDQATDELGGVQQEFSTREEDQEDREAQRRARNRPDSYF